MFLDILRPKKLFVRWKIRCNFFHEVKFEYVVLQVHDPHELLTYLKHAVTKG